MITGDIIYCHKDYMLSNLMKNLGSLNDQILFTKGKYYYVLSYDYDEISKLFSVYLKSDILGPCVFTYGNEDSVVYYKNWFYTGGEKNIAMNKIRMEKLEVLNEGRR